MVQVAASKLHGKGLFVKRAVRKDERLCIGVTEEGMRTVWARYLNHCAPATAYLLYDADTRRYHITSAAPLKPHDEVCVDYRDVEKSRSHYWSEQEL